MYKFVEELRRIADTAKAFDMEILSHLAIKSKVS